MYLTIWVVGCTLTSRKDFPAGQSCRYPPLWSSGLGRQVFTLEIAGSNPTGGARMLLRSVVRSRRTERTASATSYADMVEW